MWLFEKEESTPKENLQKLFETEEKLKKGTYEKETVWKSSKSKEFNLKNHKEKLQWWQILLIIIFVPLFALMLWQLVELLWNLQSVPARYPYDERGVDEYYEGWLQYP